MINTANYTTDPWDCDGRTVMYSTPAETDAITMIEIRANVTESGWDTVAFIEAIWPGAAANARLIAAAPPLLAACRMVVCRWERGDLSEAARACQTAVELATAGGPPWDVTAGQPAGSKPYSVLLLYPDYANDSGTETYYAFVEATGPIEAVAVARRQAASASDCVEIDPDDFAPLLVTQGHQHGEPLFNK